MRSLARVLVAATAAAGVLCGGWVVAPPASAAVPPEAVAAIDAEAAENAAELGAAVRPAEDFTAGMELGAVQRFAGGSVYWSRDTGAHAVRPAFATAYERALVVVGDVGFPATDTRDTPDGAGGYVHLSDRSGASLYARDGGPVHAVTGAVRAKWASLGWERGLGWPTTSTSRTPDNQAEYGHFDGRGGASIYWTPRHGAHHVTGPLRARWAAAGWENGLGYPTTDERPTPDDTGRYLHFTGNGRELDLYRGASSVYWTRATGAHSVTGPVRAKWAALG